MRFVDEAVIAVRAGGGGNGCVSFRREKYVPRGGPDGGDGGDGGSIVLVGNQSLQTLADLEYRLTYKAPRGQHGMGYNRTGRNAEDTMVPVPLGTDAFDAETKQRLGEVLEHEQQLVVARGGKGGKGNARFATSTRQAPRESTPGEPGTERRLKLVLRLVADIGFVGLPNAGKSTLLTALTSANPKVAAYPFTTLTPNLGVMQTRHLRYTIADMPGIIQGAHKGKGLGLRFLRHIERTRMLVFVIDGSEHDPAVAYEQLCDEIRQYDLGILQRPRIVALNKLDLLDSEPVTPDFDAPGIWISAKDRTNIEKLNNMIQNGLRQ